MTFNNNKIANAIRKQARTKLSQEAGLRDPDLRRLVGHANLLDDLFLRASSAARGWDDDDDDDGGGDIDNDNDNVGNQVDEKAAQRLYADHYDDDDDDDDEEEEEDEEDDDTTDSDSDTDTTDDSSSDDSDEWWDEPLSSPAAKTAVIEGIAVDDAGEGASGDASERRDSSTISKTLEEAEMRCSAFGGASSPPRKQESRSQLATTTTKTMEETMPEEITCNEANMKKSDTRADCSEPAMVASEDAFAGMYGACAYGDSLGLDLVSYLTYPPNDRIEVRCADLPNQRGFIGPYPTAMEIEMCSREDLELLGLV